MTTHRIRRLAMQLLRFGWVSGIGLLLDYAIYTALHLAGLPVTFANAISASCAVSFVYVAALRHVFHADIVARRRPFAKYVAYQAAAVPAASLAVGLVESALDGRFLLAKTLVVPCSFGANFLFMRWLLQAAPVPLPASTATPQPAPQRP
ncbi:MAG: GtrA family protein [Patulibacter sp.]